MNDNTSNLDSPEFDADVSAVYQAAATESVPTDVDDAVIREAAKLPRSRRQVSIIDFFQKPLTVLSFVVALLFVGWQLADEQVVEHVTPSIQTGGNTDPSGTPVASQVFDGSEATRFCDDNQTSSRESWETCVLTLQREGRVDDADLELKLLRQSYPD